MASAWGDSWGSSWGDSWGAISAVATPVRPDAGGGDSTTPRKSRRTGRVRVLIYKDEQITEATKPLEAVAKKAMTKARVSDAVLNEAIAALPKGLLNPGDLPDILPDIQSVWFAGPRPSRMELINALADHMRRQLAQQLADEDEDENEIELLLFAA